MATNFVDPRVNPAPPFRGKPRPLAEDRAAVAGLMDALEDGRLYDAERWIADGGPIQFRYPEDRRRGWKSPLQSAIRAGLHDAVLLLLCNGYRPKLERFCPYTDALRYGCHSVVHLLFAWNVDPRGVDVRAVFDSYDGQIIEEFWRKGVDLGPTEHELGEWMGWKTSNRPLYAFVKRCRTLDPKIQREADCGLRYAVEEGHEKAVHLCLWAGANPRTRVPKVSCEPEERRWWRSAIEAAVEEDKLEFFPILGLDPDVDDMRHLYSLVTEEHTYEALFAMKPPEDPRPLIAEAIDWMRCGLGNWYYRGKALLTRILATCGPVDHLEDRSIDNLRWIIHKSSWPRGADLIRALRDPALFAEGVLFRVIQSPRIVERREELGIPKYVVRRLLDLHDCPPAVKTAVRRAIGIARPRRSGARGSDNSRSRPVDKAGTADSPVGEQVLPPE